MDEKLILIKNRCLIILDYLAELSNQHSNLFDEAKEKLISSFEKGDIRSLNLCNRDLSSWVKGLSKEEQKELEEKLGEPIEIKELISQIRKILNSKKINSEEEYDIIHDYTSDLAEGDILFDRLEEMENLLHNYNVNIKDF